MNTFVFTYNRFKTISTSLWLGGQPHTVLCHTKEQAESFKASGRIGKGGGVLASLQPRGLSNNRNFVLDNLMKRGEWAIFWVDDLISVTMFKSYFRTEFRSGKLNVDATNQNVARKLFKEPVDPATFMEIALESIIHAESKGLALVGFSLTNNPMFRRNKYSYRGLADGRCWAVKKTDLRFDTNVQLIDDTCWTALNLRYFGGVVVNNWLLPDCSRYTAGSFGSRPERMEQKIRECKYLVENYPDHIGYASKSGWPPFSHVVIK